MRFATKKKAEKFGKEILKKLKGKWRMRVWENIGWHADWSHGRITLHAINLGSGPQFSCLISDSDEHSGGAMMYSYDFWSKDPNEAVEKHLQNAVNITSNEVVRLRDMLKLLTKYQRDME